MIVRGKHGGDADYSMALEKTFEAEVRAGLQENMKSLWRFGYALSGQADVADDLVQATCVRALERAHQVKDATGVRPWVMTILRSIWLNEVRSRTIRKAQSLDVTPESDLSCFSVSSETNILAREVFSAVMALPEAQREVTVLVLVQGHSYRETAAILDVPIGTIMSRLHAARAKLRPYADETSQSAMAENNR